MGRDYSRREYPARLSGYPESPAMRDAMRTLQRAPFSIVIVTGIALAAVPVLARPAENFPDKPVRVVVPFAAGSATDLLARRVAAKMSDNWNQPVVVDNRGGAGGVAG